MTSSSWLLAAYLFIIAVAGAGAAVRRTPTALRGRSLVMLTVVMAAVWGGVFLMARHVPSAASAAGVGAALVAAVATRSRWLIVHATCRGVDADIEVCARRLLLSHSHDVAGHRITSGAAVLVVRVHRMGALGTVVAVPGSPSDRKLDLFRSLLGKQYRSAVPLPAIKL